MVVFVPPDEFIANLLKHQRFDLFSLDFLIFVKKTMQALAKRLT